MMFVVQFDYRSDNGPTLCGPFATRAAADKWAAKQCPEASSWLVVPLFVPDNDKPKRT